MIMAESINLSIRSSPRINEIPFLAFWLRSRYRTIVDGVDAKINVRDYFENIKSDGGFVHYLECNENGKFAGSMVVYRDLLYRSYQRDNVACFGLVTASHAGILKAMLDRAIGIIENYGLSVMRGPVNAPRSLFGYGVQSWGQEYPIIAGSSADPPRYSKMYAIVEKEHYFDKRDIYYNILQDFEKSKAYLATMDFDRNFRFINPDLDAFDVIASKIADMMNLTLNYRPDFLSTNEKRVKAAVEMYKLVPGAEKLMGLLYDGDIFAGAVIMQPDWFQVLSGRPLTQLIGDITMLDKAYQGRRLYLNFSEYYMDILSKFGCRYLEHASMWENQEAVKASLSKGVTKLIKQFWMYELHS